MSKTKIEIPKYQQIAVNIAARIVSGDYSEGDRLFARSSLATTYGVSSETARRAILVLQDVGIVEVTKGSGVIILDAKKAIEFVNQFQEVTSIVDLREDIQASVTRQAKELDHLNDLLDKVVSQTERFQTMNAFTPFKIEIREDMKFLNQTIGSLSFWQHTGATIVALRRKQSLMLSPGPYAEFQQGDIFYFIGEPNCLERVTHYLYESN